MAASSELFAINKDSIFESNLLSQSIKDKGHQDKGGLHTRGFNKHSLPHKPLISIITVVFNGAETIRDTIESVLKQSYGNIEYIIVDGGSSDATVDILRQYDHVVDCWISEKDKGIYDAMNKGIALARGDVIGTLNADDFYIYDHVLENVAQVFLDPAIDACYGDLLYVNQNNVEKTVRFWKSNDYELGLFKSGWMPAHPTFFVRKSVYDRLGGFNLNYKIAADFELLFRFIEQNKIRTQYLPKVLVKMRLGGTTNQSWSNILKQNKEMITILRKHHADFSLVKFVFKKILNRLFQFVLRPKNDYDD
ncbi:MAG TPA: glycosyltransferase family 2 protein [Methylotenera sp.]|nr:glycosyltransferase family 2 protein [Methylotenera sp.]